MNRNRNRKATALTLTLIAALGLILFARQRGAAPTASLLPESREATPQDAVYEMFDAARDGNTATYIGYFTGPMEIALKQSLAENGETNFARYLKDQNAPIKGIAINEPNVVNENTVSARVEYVYADRNEAQTMTLEKVGGRWKIARLDQAERVKTLVPYGTKVQ